jgi:hypothetical protein
LYITPIIVRTSRGHKGGVVSYNKIKPQIDRLCKQDATAHISTMFDLYALPKDFPGKNSPDWSKQRTGRQKAELVETCLARDIAHRNFIPNIMVHEYEALLFVDPRHFFEWADQKVVDKLAKVRQSAAPEDINDSPHTAPSKHILSAMPDYQKAIHGPLIACDIGLDAIRADCPHFDAWLCRLERLAG